jgi:hypothetical protein
MKTSGGKEKNTPIAATLREILLGLDTRPKVLADCQTLIDEEIADKSEAPGAAIKLAYKTATSFALATSVPSCRTCSRRSRTS